MESIWIGGEDPLLFCREDPAGLYVTTLTRERFAPQVCCTNVLERSVADTV